jgi:protease I
MASELRGKRIAALVDDGFEQVELTEPKQALEGAGAHVDVVSPQPQKVKGWQHTKWGDEFSVDQRLDSATAGEYDALLLPGGVMNPDRLRTNEKAVALVKAFADAGKPIAAICHGPWTLIDAGVVRGRTLTSWPSLATDLRNAGANWVDEECVNDNGLVTARKPADIPAFNRKMIEEFAEGQHEPGRAGRTFVGSPSNR